MKIGAQLFSLRRYLKDEAGYRRVFAAVRDMGAEVVQLSAAGGNLAVNSGQIAAVSAEYGLPVCVTHSPVARIKDDLARLAEEHLQFGCRSIGIGMMPKEYRTGRADDVRRFADFLNVTSEKLRQYGMSVAYHNHGFEFKPTDGGRPYDILISETDTAVKFIPDTFWIKAAGCDISEYLAKLNGRVETVHFKDYGRIFGLPIFRAVGKGDIDFAAVTKECEAIGARYAVAELDVSPSPLKSMEFSLETMKRIRGKMADD